MSTCFHGFQFSRTWCNTQEMGLYKSDTMEYFASSSVLQHAICFVFQTKLVHELVGPLVFSEWRQKKKINNLCMWCFPHIPLTGVIYSHFCIILQSQMENHKHNDTETYSKNERKFTIRYVKKL